jgi:hypothetical protein
MAGKTRCLDKLGMTICRRSFSLFRRERVVAERRVRVVSAGEETPYSDVLSIVSAETRSPGQYPSIETPVQPVTFGLTRK